MKRVGAKDAVVRFTPGQFPPLPGVSYLQAATFQLYFTSSFCLLFSSWTYHIAYIIISFNEDGLGCRQ